MGGTGAVERALERVETTEATVHAFAYLDAERARAEARAAPDGSLTGLVVGAKDLFDTADQPTEYGSPIYRDHRPRADAAAVALLRAAGAVVVGKTVTAELGWFSPGPTRNPHRPNHTPGGSSSGSAAAVAAHMVDLALGTQTGGSVIRPASFCGVLGFKPTFGSVPTAGVKQGAPSLDTVGLFARDVLAIDRARVALTRRPGLSDAGANPRIALVRTEQWDEADADGRNAIETAAEVAGAKERALPSAFVGLAAQQPITQAFEGARSLAWERNRHGDLLSLVLRKILDWGEAIGSEQYDQVRSRAVWAQGAQAIDELFGDADVLLTPGVVGEAPEGIEGTGDPRFCRMWTLVGFPAVSVPGLTGASGLPVGVQLIARPHDDARLLAIAGWLMARLA